MGDVVGKLPVREPPVPLSRRTEALLEISKVLIPVLASVITAGWIAFSVFRLTARGNRRQIEGGTEALQ